MREEGEPAEARNFPEHPREAVLRDAGERLVIRPEHRAGGGALVLSAPGAPPKLGVVHGLFIPIPQVRTVFILNFKMVGGAAISSWSQRRIPVLHASGLLFEGRDSRARVRV